MSSFRAAWLHRAEVDDSAWAATHDAARERALAGLGFEVECVVADGVDHGAPFAAAARELARDGVAVIFICDRTGGEAVVPVAAAFPEVCFDHCQGLETAANFGTYREAKDDHAYVSGVLAGAMTKTGVLGCIGGQPSPSDLTFSNAWALGVKAVNPGARIQIRWVGSYRAPDQDVRERALMLELIELGADVFGGTMTEHPTMSRVALEQGVLTMECDLRSREIASVLDVAYVDWAPYYAQALRAVRDGTWRARRTVLHARDGVSVNSPPAAWVPEEAAARATAAADALRTGMLDIWRGPLLDNLGGEIVGSGKTLGDRYDGPEPEPGMSRTDAYLESDQVRWLVDNVVGAFEMSEWVSWTGRPLAGGGSTH